jgi:hypothetical protein
VHIVMDNSGTLRRDRSSGSPNPILTSPFGILCASHVHLGDGLEKQPLIQVLGFRCLLGRQISSRAPIIQIVEQRIGDFQRV